MIFLVFQVGCKKDIADSDPTCREVSREEAESYAASRDMKHFETSSKTRAKVEQAFTSLSQTSILRDFLLTNRCVYTKEIFYCFQFMTKY